MTELLKAATDFFTAGAAYFKSQMDAGADPAAEPKRGRGRPAKAAGPTIPETPAPTPAAPAPAQAKDAEVVLSEEQSLVKVRELAKEYVLLSPDQKEGIAAWRKLLSETCKVAKIEDLDHAARLKAIEAVSAKLNLAKAPKAPATSSGVEV